MFLERDVVGFSAGSVQTRVNSVLILFSMMAHQIQLHKARIIRYFPISRCKCQYTLPSLNFEKLTSRRRAAMFERYDAESLQVYKLIRPITHRKSISRGVMSDRKSAVQHLSISRTATFDISNEIFGAGCDNTMKLALELSDIKHVT